MLTDQGNSGDGQEITIFNSIDLVSDLISFLTTLDLIVAVILLNASSLIFLIKILP